MPRRPRNSNENENENENSSNRKRGKAIELHGHSCEEINYLLKGLSTSEKKEILDKFSKGNTALQEAVTDNNTASVKCLLDLGASPNKRINVKAYTALHSAVLGNKLEIVNLLLEAGADPTLGILHNERVFTPLYTAAEKGHFDILDSLLQNDDVVLSINDPLQDDPYMTPLTIAVLEGHKIIVEFLKANGAEFEPKQPYTKDDMQNFLITGINSKDLRRIKFLLEEFDFVKAELHLSFDGIDVNYISDEDYTPLFNACILNNNLEIIEYLRSKGAELAEGELAALKEAYKTHGGNIPKAYKYFIEPVTTPPRRIYNNNTRNRKQRRGKRKTRKV